jgi:RNA polymerase sigma-70 factor (ECF subfamily)
MPAATCSPARQASDEQLVQRILSGEREAFDQLYARYVGRVFRFVEKRLRNRADVEETTQEVFISVFSSLVSFRAEAPFAAWVLGVARHTIASRFKKKHHPTVPLEPDEDGDIDAQSFAPSTGHEATPLEFYELRERITQLEAAAEQDLSPEQQQLFRLHHLEHRPIAEVAAFLDKSEDAVKSNLYRVRKVLLAR